MSHLIKEPSLDIFNLKLHIKKYGWILICSAFLMILSTCIPSRASQVALVVKNPPANAGDVRDLGLIAGSGRAPGAGNGNPLEYSCLKNPMDRGAWWTTVQWVTKRQTRLSNLAHVHTSLKLLLLRFLVTAVLLKPMDNFKTQLS